MKVGDKVKVVWNEDICGKNSNTYEYDGRMGIISFLGFTENDCVEVVFNGIIRTVYARALQLVEDKPEYYEYVKTSIGSFTEGKIYKVLDPYNLETYSNFIDNQGDKNGFAPLNHRYFKSSTKEAFDKQNNIETEFIVPKQWHINVKTPEQAKVVGRWFDQSEFADPSLPNFYENDYNRLGIYGGVRAGDVYGNQVGTRITYEQFEKYILKQNNKQNNMEIIGYKSPMKIGIHAKGELYIQYSSNEDLYIPDSTKDMGSEAFYSIPKEIVEMWEPVYKETSKTLVLGTSRIKIVISKGKIDVDNGNEIKFDSLNGVYRIMSGRSLTVVGRPTDYAVSFPKGVKIGCSEFEIDEIKLIIDTYNELNK
jgi:hypothetical protein